MPVEPFQLVVLGARLPVLFAQPVEALLDYVEIAQDQLRIEVAQVARGVGRRAVRGDEAAHHQAESIDLRERPQGLCRKPRALPRGTRHVDEDHLREGRLARLEDLRQGVDPRIGHLDRPEVDVRPPRRPGFVQPGQRVEERRLSGLRKSDEARLHEDPPGACARHLLATVARPRVRTLGRCEAPAARI